MQQEDLENEFFTPKHPFIAKTKHATREKNHFCNCNKRMFLIGLGVLLMLTIVGLVAFIEDNTYNYITKGTSPKRQKIYLVNWHEKVYWAKGLCYVQSIEHLDWTQLSYPDAVILNVSRENANSVWLPYRNEYSPFIMLAVPQQQQISLEINLANLNKVNTSNPFKRFDFVLTYDAESNIIWRRYQIEHVYMEQLYKPKKTQMDKFINDFQRFSYLKRYSYSFPVVMTVMNEPCNGTRNALVQQIAEHMEVHIYGSCSDRRCPDNTCDFLPIYVPSNQYKFYLAFENDDCNNYISDDFFNALGRIVPVVYGGANYSLLAPPSSYIDASTFSSMESLSHYLKMLDSEPNKYINYYAWTDFYKITEFNNIFQDICYLMNNNYMERKESFEDYLFEDHHSRNWWEKARCQQQ